LLVPTANPKNDTKRTQKRPKLRFGSPCTANLSLETHRMCSCFTVLHNKKIISNHVCMDMDESANQKFLGLVHALSRNLFNSCRLTNMSFFSNHGMYNCFGPVLDDLVLVKTEIRALSCVLSVYMSGFLPQKRKKKKKRRKGSWPWA